MSPKQYNWTVTFSPDDKNPFGGYAFNELLQSHTGPIRHSYKTLYELRDSVKAGSSLLIIAEAFSPGDEDAIALLDHVYKGGAAFISTKHLGGKFADTLKLNLRSGDIFTGSDSSSLHIVSAQLDTLTTYHFQKGAIENQVYNFDTTRTLVVAVNEEHRPVTIRMKWGKGDLLINSTPLMFTNMCLLAGDNNKLVSTQLSYLPGNELTWTEFYQLGRREVSTPLRFILQNEPLAWAYYISILCLLGFMLFEIKRRQRIIPVIRPLANTTLEFVATIGDLYYQNGDHKNIAGKKVTFFLEYVRTKYSLSTNQLDEAFAAALAKKSGRDEKSITALLWVINEVKARPVMTSHHLIELNSKLEAFYNNS
ncbi:DUF4350 domain-containing protein [Chryseolinea sp. T2]|uniref:DUF4350 domain-containing protein n=1 Tax=Chryseolinea sp. T2 TaxID=3129255 RepID=UPI003077A68C